MPYHGKVVVLINQNRRNMKKVLVIAMSFVLLQACSNNRGESGAVDDGFKGYGDSNGGLADTTYNRENQSNTDTSKGEHRVDISTRDTLDHGANH